MSKPILATALTAATLLGAPFAAYADSGHGHGADQQDAQNGGEDEAHGESEGHGPSAMNAASPAGVWAELMAARDAIAADVENGELGSIHEKSEPLPELGAAFLEQSGDLDASKRARVEGALKQIGRIADVLHTAADGDDLARTRKALARLDGLLELIQVQYPAGMLGMGAKIESMAMTATPWPRRRRTERTRICSAHWASSTSRRGLSFAFGPPTDSNSNRSASSSEPGFRLGSNSRTLAPSSTRWSSRCPTAIGTGSISTSRRASPMPRPISSTRPAATRCSARFRGTRRPE